MSESRRIRVLVVGAPLGGGHMAAARAVARHLERAGPDTFEVAIDDIGSVLFCCGHPLGPPLARAYQWCVSTLGGRPQRYIYSIAERWPLLVCRIATKPFRRQAIRWLRARDPDIVVSTFSVVSYAAGAILADQSAPVLSIVTDAGRINRIWLVGPVDHFAFSSSVATSFARASGLRPSMIEELGYLVDPGFLEAPTRSEARKQLGLDEHFTVLLTAGGVGYGPGVLKFASEISRREISTPTQFIVAAGRNPRLQKALESTLGNKARFVSPEEPTLRDHIAAADIVVGKAGWMTLMEAAVLRRPTLIVDRIQGQEFENASEAEASGTARVVSASEAVRLVQSYATDRGIFARDFGCCMFGDAAHHASSLDIASVITRAVGTHRGSSESCLSDAGLTRRFARFARLV